MNIEKIASITPEIKNKKLIITFSATGVPITDIRLMDFLNDSKKLAKDLDNTQINEFYFIFNIDKLKIPSNFNLFKQYASFLEEHKDLLMNKLVYSVLQCENNIFKMFFNLFKAYYIPVKPLYLCKNEKEVTQCLENESFRNSLPNMEKMV